MAGDSDVVPLHEEDLAPESFIPADRDDLFEQILPHFIARMGLAGKDDVGRPGGVVEDPIQTVEVGKDQIRPFVRGEAPCETDDQGCRVDFREELLLPVFRVAVFHPIPGEVLAEEVGQLLPKFISRPPQNGVGDVLDPFPPLAIGDMAVPVHAEIGIKEGLHPGGDVGEHMGAVCDMTDGDIRFVKSFPDVPPHPAGNLAVEAAHGVASVGHLEGKNCHEEGLPFTAFLATQFPELGPGDPRPFHEIRKVMLDQLLAESFVSGLHRGVCRKDGAAADDLARLVEGEPLFRHQLVDPFEQEESRVAFVYVVDAGTDSQLFQDPDASHPQEDLLLDPRPRFGAVEALGDFTVLGGVPRDVGIQKVKRDAPHPNLPDIGE